MSSLLTLLRRTSVVLTVGIVLGVMAPAAAPSFAEDQGISAGPAVNGDIDRTRSRFVYQVDPGQTVQDEFFVKNVGTVPQVVTVYATDAFNSDNGDFALLNTGVPSKEAGTWVTFGGGETTFELQPDEARALPFTMSVPATASPGDHAGGLIVSAVTGSGQVKIDRRVATRMYVRVSGDVQPVMTMSDVELSYRPSWNPFDGTLTVTYQLNNTGNVALGAKATTDIGGVFGIPVRSDVTEVNEMLPGTSRVVSTDITGIPQWLLLSASVKVDSSVPEDSQVASPLPSVARTATTWVMPWAVLLLLVILLLIVWIRRIRARAHQRRVVEWQQYEALQRKTQEGQ